jgi:hypothetical protein
LKFLGCASLHLRAYFHGADGHFAAGFHDWSSPECGFVLGLSGE